MSSLLPLAAAATTSSPLVLLAGFKMAQEPLCGDELGPVEWREGDCRGWTAAVPQWGRHGAQVVRGNGGNTPSLAHRVVEFGLQEQELRSRNNNAS